MLENTVKSKFLGSVKRVEYTLYEHFYHGIIFDTNIQKDITHVKNVVIYECVLNSPLLEVGEEFLIEKSDGSNNIVKIIKRVRNNKNEIVYYTNEIVEIIEDELTAKTLEFAQIEKLKRDKEIERRKILRDLRLKKDEKNKDMNNKKSEIFDEISDCLASIFKKK